jgi:predicted  nucleic acid-binding Zn-ribbon protein
MKRCARCRVDIRPGESHETAEDCLGYMLPRYKGMANQVEQSKAELKRAAEREKRQREGRTFDGNQIRRVGALAELTERVRTLEAAKRDTADELSQVRQRLRFLLNEYERLTEQREVRWRKSA